jgi:type IV pilus biogenesis protein CpaD/CtpE
MTHPIRALAALLVCIGLAGCVAYPYPYEAQTTMVPASFDRSWDAALGAASDSGIQVTSADRASGRITGTKAGAAGTITVERQSGGNVRVGFSAPDARESNPTLNDRWLSNYNRRMGR